MEASSNPDGRERRAFYEADGPGPAVFEFERLAPPDYRVMRPFDYVDHLGHWYRVPVDVENNRTDFASIPFFLTWLVPKDGSHTPAAVLHDALIGGEQGVDYETSAEHVDDRHADYLFREAMAASGVSWLRRWLMWSAVALRTLSVGFEPNPAGGRPIQKTRWWRVVLIGVAIGLWGLLAAAMALDVPDLLASDLPAWLDWLVWIGDRPWYTEIGLGLLLVAGGAVAMALVFALVLGAGRPGDAFTRGAAAGAIGGVVVGFLGLPMIASLVGAAGYWVLDRLAALRYPNRVQETAGDSLGELA